MCLYFNCRLIHNSLEQFKEFERHNYFSSIFSYFWPTKNKLTLHEILITLSNLDSSPHFKSEKLTKESNSVSFFSKVSGGGSQVIWVSWYNSSIGIGSESRVDGAHY